MSLQLVTVVMAIDVSGAGDKSIEAAATERMHGMLRGLTQSDLIDYSVGTVTPSNASLDGYAKGDAFDGSEAPRVLITVRGGVADYVADNGVRVELFDWDNYNVDPFGTEKPGPEFRDLAVPLNIPINEGPLHDVLRTYYL